MSDDVNVRVAAIEDWLDDYAGGDRMTEQVRYLLNLRREERSWRGLLAFLDEHYPEDVFLPDPKAPDQLPRIVWMARQIARVRELHSWVLEGETKWCAGCSYTWPCLTIRTLDDEDVG